MTDEHPPDSINEFAVIGDFGFLRVQGPLTVEKEGTNWTITAPPEKAGLLSDAEGERAALVADCEIVGGGVITVVDQPDGHDELHVVVDQYARGVNDD